jgi:uncharacterized damage-inducible protein DinB
VDTVNLPDYFLTLADYHVWATRLLLDEHLAGLSDDEWHRDAGLFFRSVHGTVNHLLVSEEIWFARFAENRSPRIALNAELHADRIALCEALGKAVTRWGAWMAALDAARWDGELVYTRNSGQVVRIPFAPALGHVFNHATHHRGQINAAITGMGRPCPELDWIYKLQGEMDTGSGSQS